MKRRTKMNIFGIIFLQFTSDVDYPMPFLHFQKWVEFLLPEYHLSYYVILIKLKKLKQKAELNSCTDRYQHLTGAQEFIGELAKFAKRFCDSRTCHWKASSKLNMPKKSVWIKNCRVNTVRIIYLALDIKHSLSLCIIFRHVHGSWSQNKEI